MAWQLIYTSAPRLLEAGRSGFGTIARHREIPPLLVATIERISQFARQPGLNLERVIYAYRIITVGSGRFHVLSCIRDAGASFTGRTNHLAHHLIAEPREVATLGPHGPSSADLLLAFPWLPAWNDPPRWLDDSDGKNLRDYQPQTSHDGAWWASVTGNPAHAGLLAYGEASRNAALLTPPGCDLRPLFAESLRLTPERLWQVPFTTALQPSDDSADFRWVGATSGDSAGLSGQRTVLDLTAPHALPIPEMPAQLRVRKEAVAVDPLSSPTTLPSFPTASAATHADPDHRADRAKADDPFDGYKPPRKGTSSWLLVAAGLFLLTAVSGTVFVLQRMKVARSEALAEALRPLHGIAYFDGLKFREQLEHDLQSRSPVEIARVLPLVEFSASLTSMLTKPNFEKLRSKPAHETAQKLASDAGLNLPPAIGSLATGLDEAARQEKELRDFSPLAVGAEGLTRFQKQCAEWTAKNATSYPQQDFVNLRGQLSALGARQQASALRHLLGDGIIPSEQDTWFRDRRDAIMAAWNDPEAARLIKEVDTILNDWRYVRNEAPTTVARWLETASKEHPTWLRRLAQKNSAPAKASTRDMETAREKTPPAEPKPEPVAAGTIYLAGSKDSLAKLTIKELRADLQFELLGSDGTVTKLGYRAGASVRRNAHSENDGFKIDGLSLAAESGAPPPPFQLAARDPTSGSELFRIYVGAVDGEKPLFGAFTNGLQAVGSIWRVTAELPSLAVDSSTTYQLLGTKAAPFQKNPLMLSFDAKLQTNVEKLIEQMRQQLASARAGAKQKDREALALKDGGPSLDDLRKAVTAVAAKSIPDEKLRTGINLNAKSAAELVGDFGRALADYWQQKATKGTGSDRLEAFNAIQTQSRELVKASEDEKKVRVVVDELLKNILRANKVLRVEPYTTDLTNLRSLANQVQVAVGDRETIEAHAKTLSAAAESASQAAKAIEASPLLNGKIPPDTYTLTARLPDGVEIKLCTITVTDLP